MAKTKCVRRKFTSSDISKIATLTNENFHGEARELIAKRICSPTEKKFHKINKEHTKIGHLSPDLARRRNRAEEALFAELRRRLKPSEVNEIFNSL